MEEAIRIYNEYVKTFDMTDPMIMLKYHHSLRVMEYSKCIAESLDLSENDILLASLCGLFHDIGRFTQWTTYNTYKDHKSVDHGNEGFTVMEDGLLKKLELDSNQEKILMTSIKQHNKMNITCEDERVRLFIKITRDADKLDIIETCGISNNDEEIIFKEELLNELFNGEMCKCELVETNTDYIVRYISWINDYNFEYSYKYLKEKNVIENKLHLLELYGSNETTNRIREYVNKKFEEKGI